MNPVNVFPQMQQNQPDSQIQNQNVQFQLYQTTSYQFVNQQPQFMTGILPEQFQQQQQTIEPPNSLTEDINLSFSNQQIPFQNNQRNFQPFYINQPIQPNFMMQDQSILLYNQLVQNQLFAQQPNSNSGLNPFLINNQFINRAAQIQQQMQQIPPLKSQLPPKYSQLRDEPTCENQFNKNEPYLKIKIMKSTSNTDNQYNSNQEYFINARGMIGSERNTIGDDVMIGRCQSIMDGCGQKVVPNDIVLPMSDRAISRVHCKIITKNAFSQIQELSEEFKEFLRIRIPSSCQSMWAQLPLHVIKQIWAYAQPTKQYFIQDAGSVFGTFIKLYNIKPQKIEKGQIYFIGADNTFNILECQTERDILKYENKSLNNQPNNQQSDLIAQLISQDYQRGFIHGLSEDELNLLESSVEQMQQQGNDTYILGKSFQRPYIKVEIYQSTSTQESTTSRHIFFGPPIEQFTEMQIEYPKTVFRIGRGGEDNHIRIPHNTISRKQCRFWYCKQQDNWYISDGDNIRESSNGTWLSLQNFYEKETDKRQESIPKPLEHGAEIKISDSILKVEMFNMNQRQKLLEIVYKDKKNLKVTKTFQS